MEDSMAAINSISKRVKLTFIIISRSWSWKSITPDIFTSCLQQLFRGDRCAGQWDELCWSLVYRIDCVVFLWKFHFINEAGIVARETKAGNENMDGLIVIVRIEMGVVPSFGRCWRCLITLSRIRTRRCMWQHPQPQPSSPLRHLQTFQCTIRCPMQLRKWMDKIHGLRPRIIYTNGGHFTRTEIPYPKHCFPLVIR